MSICLYIDGRSVFRIFRSNLRTLTMRLTLRTLLAYIDGQLNDSDAQELEKKIKKSEFAQTLQSRIDKLGKRHNMLAPKVSARGIGDANKVAEYIDGTMEADLVADFERACLESDIHLAEVSACHQILIQLGKEIPVAHELRQRLYRLDKFPLAAEPPEPPPHGDIEERFIDSTEEQIIYGNGDVFELTAPSGYRGDQSPTDKDIAVPEKKWKTKDALAHPSDFGYGSEFIVTCTGNRLVDAFQWRGESKRKIGTRTSKCQACR